jgi:hypothetical protein
MLKLKYRLDRKTLETVYFSFVRPKLEYGSIIWDDCFKYQKELLDNIQLTYERIVTGAKRGTSHSLLHMESNWPSLSERRNLSKMKFFHKIYHRTAPSYLLDLVDINNTSNRYNTRHKNDIKMIYTRTEKFRNTLIPDCIRKWNSIPSEVRENPNLNEFVRKIENKSVTPQWYFGVCLMRKLEVIHAQLRMRCSDLKADLFNLHVSMDPFCICSDVVEDSNHFFFNCNLYNIQREILLDNLKEFCGDREITLELILYGDLELSLEVNRLIVENIEKFILESGRFSVYNGV